MLLSLCRFGDGDGDLHPQQSLRGTRVGAPQGQYLIGRPRHGDTDEITVADDAVSGVEIDPAGAGQIGLHPCMRGSATRMRGSATGMIGSAIGVSGSAVCETGSVGHEDIAADKPRCNT